MGRGEKGLGERRGRWGEKMGRGEEGRERTEGEEREVGENWEERGKERGWGTTTMNHSTGSEGNAQGQSSAWRNCASGVGCSLLLQ